MLDSISIKNIALISDETIHLQKGLNVITGETGAGKSLVVESIALLLGDKADRSLISHDKDYAYVEAVFTSTNKKVLDLLRDAGIDVEDQIIVSRKLYKEGKNECRVNGKSLTLSSLKRIVAPLMDLHGQFEHQSVLSNDYQLELIDGLGGNNLLQTKQNFAENFTEYTRVKKQLEEFTEDDKERERLIDLYNYQIQEIEEANFKPGEEEYLKDYRIKMSNLQKITTALDNSFSVATGGMDGSGGLVDILSKMMGALSSVSQYSNEIEELTNRIDGAKIDLADIVDSIESISSGMEYNQEEAQINEERLDLLNSFKKKYGQSIEEINEYLEKTKAERDKLVNSTEYIEKLKREKAQLANKLKEVANRLTKQRKEVAKQLEANIIKELDDLAMKNTKFVVEFDIVDIDQSTGNGLDRVEYMFSANAGEPVKPLSKIISGGEMSRFMLAIKNITANIEEIDTMIFDEIDTGVSGVVAGSLAKKLLIIAKNHQVICVSHLSQVAAYATSQFYISKSTVSGKTTTSVKLLNKEQRIEEIARLIGGTKTEHSISHAKLMMQEAEEYAKTIK